MEVYWQEKMYHSRDDGRSGREKERVKNERGVRGFSSRWCESQEESCEVLEARSTQDFSDGGFRRGRQIPTLSFTFTFARTQATNEDHAG